MQRAALLAGVVASAMLALAACSDRPAGWSEPAVWKDGTTRSTATVGLALSLGASGHIEMTFGSSGTGMGDETPAARADVNTAGALPVGTWTLAKGNTRISLPRDGSGFPQDHGLYENTHGELWALVTSPGCSTLSTFSTNSIEPGASIIERTYRLCDVDRAAARLRAQR